MHVARTSKKEQKRTKAEPTSYSSKESKTKSSLRALASETTSELEVLGLDRDTLGVDGGQVG